MILWDSIKWNWECEIDHIYLTISIKNLIPGSREIFYHKINYFSQPPIWLDSDWSLIFFTSSPSAPDPLNSWFWIHCWPDSISCPYIMPKLGYSTLSMHNLADPFFNFSMPPFSLVCIVFFFPRLQKATQCWPQTSENLPMSLSVSLSPYI